MTAGGDPELEELLRSADPVEPRPGHREACRSAFLAAAAEAADPAPSRSSEDPRNPDDMARATGKEGELEEMIRRGDSPSVPRSAFREELRKAFLVPLSPEALSVPPAASSDVDGARPASEDAGTPRGQLFTFRRAFVLAVAAAAVFLISRLPKPEVWSVERLEGGSVTVDGVALDDGDRQELGVRLAAGGRLETEAGTLDLRMNDWVVVRVLPGTEVAFSELPEGGSEAIALELERGEVLVETLPGYPGNPLLVSTEESIVRVTGTAFGVLRDDRGTCTCVSRGTVEVRDPRIADGSFQEVNEASTVLFFRRGADQEIPMAKEMPFPGTDSEEYRLHTRWLEDFVSGH